MHLAVAVALWLLACSRAPAEELALTLARDPRGGLSVGLAVTGADHQRLVESLERGLESAVTYELRLYRRTRGLLGLFGDRLLGRLSVRRTATVDFLDHRYILLEGDGSSRAYQEGEVFVREFLSLRSLPLPWQAPAGGDTYLLGRARLEYVRLEPPLGIVALLRPASVVTAWRRVAVTEGGEAPP